MRATPAWKKLLRPSVLLCVTLQDLMLRPQMSVEMAQVHGKDVKPAS
jgi:hypothetical protein